MFCRRRSGGDATTLALGAAVWTVVLCLRVCLTPAGATEVEATSENSILGLFHKHFGKQNLEPDDMHAKKDFFITPANIDRVKSKQGEISSRAGQYFPENRASQTTIPTIASHASQKKRLAISGPKSKSFVKITFSSPKLIRRSMRKLLKKIKASAESTNEITWKKIETPPFSPRPKQTSPLSPVHKEISHTSPVHGEISSTSPVHKEISPLSPVHGEISSTSSVHKEIFQLPTAQSILDRLRPELGSLFEREEHSSVGLLQTVLRQQLPLEESAPNSIYDSFLVSSPGAKLYQPEVGGSCFSSLGEPGMCVPLEDCPQLRPLVKQLHVKNAAILLVQQLCRLGGTKYFVCCEYPAFQNPPHAVGAASAALPKLQKSPYPAPLPGGGECGAVGPLPGGEDGQNRALEPHEWPWLAAVGRPQDREAFTVLCTGTIITRRHVLTAATCFYLQEVRQPTMVRVGEHDSTVKEGSSQQDFLIVGRNDPGWVIFFNQENLMVLTLDRDVTFSMQVQPACLPSPNIAVPEVGSSAVSAGWKRFRTARNASGDDAPSSPLLTNLEVVSLRECQTAYSNLEANFFIVDGRNVCVVEDEEDPQCCAEVGAPVMQEREDGTYEVVGVVTVPSVGTVTQYLPTVGTRVSVYRQWLEHVTGA